MYTIVIYQILTKYVNVISKQFLFQQLGVIIAIVKQHIRNYLNDIFTIIKVQSLQYFEADRFQVIIHTMYMDNFINNKMYYGNIFLLLYYN